MTDLAIALLREPEYRVFTSSLSPASFLALLRQSIDASRTGAVPLVAEFTGSTFTILVDPHRGRTTSPVALWGSVEAAGNGSRVSYRAGLPRTPRMLLQFWAALSVVLLLFSAVTSGAALIMGDWGSIPFGLLRACLVGLVWWIWRRVGNQVAVLEDWVARQASETPG